MCTFSSRNKVGSIVRSESPPPVKEKSDEKKKLKEYVYGMMAIMLIYYMFVL